MSYDKLTEKEMRDIIGRLIDVYKHNNNDMEYSGHYAELILKEYNLLPGYYGDWIGDDITFCKDDCADVFCFRNPINMKNKVGIHSYAHFSGTEYCKYHNHGLDIEGYPCD